MTKIEGALFVTIALALFVAVFVAGMALGSSDEKRNAIKAGLAHYTADENGYVKFEYLPK